ncbi:MAG: hypothetical protein ACRDS9_23205 [Pseudonocardiaceae bacterium]
MLIDPRTFARIDVIQDSIRELYAKLSGETVKSYATSLTPLFSTIPRGQDPVTGAEQVARAIARHLRITDVGLIVSFKELRHEGELKPAAEVTLGAGPDYHITLNPRYRDDRQDTAAVLAHEVMHIFLHRSGIGFVDRIKNEILTETASVYLGTGWLTLNAHRTTTTYSGGASTTSTQTLGYVSPEELGYILAKRVLTFDENIETYLSRNNLAREAYGAGYRRALLDYQRAPLADCGPTARVQYQKDKKYAAELARSGSFALPFDAGYQFQGNEPMNVVFHCPTCHHLAEVPVDRSVTVRCGTCASALKCQT